MAEADLNTVINNTKYPVKVGYAIVLFTFFLLRELECACAQYSDMTVDIAGKSVALRLSVSKNDPRALGCTRRWGCVCADAVDARTCPFHAALGLRTHLCERFGDRVNEPAFPLFPDSFGHEVSAVLMLDLILELATLLGEPLVNQAGRNRYGKHTWRSTGAVHLGESGVDTNKIGLMGRWWCSVVLHYTRLAPITNIANDYKRAKTKAGIDETVRSLSASQKKIREAVELMTTSMKTEVADLQAKVDKIARETAPRQIVVNKVTGKVHRVLTSIQDAGAEAVAHCGFQYAYCQKVFHSEIPAGTKRDKACGACFRGVRDSLPR